VIAGTKYADDWSVLRSGTAVGRVYLMQDTTGASRWFWASFAPAAGGRVDTLEEALEAVRSKVSEE